MSLVFLRHGAVIALLLLAAASAVLQKPVLAATLLCATLLAALACGVPYEECLLLAVTVTLLFASSLGRDAP